MLSKTTQFVLTSGALILALIVAPFSCSAAVVESADIDNYFRVIWGLLVVLGIILILYGLMRKRFSLLNHSPDKEIEIVEVKPLMGKKALCLVKVKDQEFLLGLSGDRISHLATLETTPKKEFQRTLEEASSNGAAHD